MRAARRLRGPLRERLSDHAVRDRAAVLVAIVDRDARFLLDRAAGLHRRVPRERHAARAAAALLDREARAIEHRDVAGELAERVPGPGRRRGGLRCAVRVRRGMRGVRCGHQREGRAEGEKQPTLLHPPHLPSSPREQGGWMLGSGSARRQGFPARAPCVHDGDALSAAATATAAGYPGRARASTRLAVRSRISSGLPSAPATSRSRPGRNAR